MKQITKDLSSERWIGTNGVALIYKVGNEYQLFVHWHSSGSCYIPTQLNFPCTVDNVRVYQFAQSARRWVANNL